MDKKEKALHIAQTLQKLYPNPHTPLHHTSPWELYVAVVLSAQNTDKGVNNVTQDLFKKYKTLDDYCKASYEEFDKDISKINFHKNKAKSIKGAADIIAEQYGGKLPQTMEELVKLPGVGRKTANVILQEAFGKTEGIVVDTHVKRLANLFGLTNSQDPEKIEQDLIQLLPKEMWHNFALGLILYGREYCPARCKHVDCPLREQILH